MAGRVRCVLERRRKF